MHGECQPGDGIRICQNSIKTVYRYRRKLLDKEIKESGENENAREKQIGNANNREQ